MYSTAVRDTTSTWSVVSRFGLQFWANKQAFRDPTVVNNGAIQQFVSAMRPLRAVFVVRSCWQHRDDGQTGDDHVPVCRVSLFANERTLSTVASRSPQSDCGLSGRLVTLCVVFLSHSRLLKRMFTPTCSRENEGCEFPGVLLLA